MTRPTLLPRLNRREVEKRYGRMDFLTETPDYRLIDIIDPDSLFNSWPEYMRWMAYDAFIFVCGRGASGTTSLCRTLRQRSQRWPARKRLRQIPLVTTRTLRPDEDPLYDVMSMSNEEFDNPANQFLIRYQVGRRGRRPRAGARPIKRSGMLLSLVEEGVLSYLKNLVITMSPAADLVARLYFPGSQRITTEITPEDHLLYKKRRGLDPRDGEDQSFAGFTLPAGTTNYSTPGGYRYENERWRLVANISRRSSRDGIEWPSLHDYVCHPRLLEVLEREHPWFLQVMAKLEETH